MSSTCVIAARSLPLASLLRRYAEQSGLEVVEVAEGDRMLEVARRVQPSVIFIDVMLPGKARCQDVLQALRADAQTGPIPIVTVGFNTEDDLTRLAKGASAYLSGVLGYQDFLAVLARVGIKVQAGEEA